MAGRMIKSRNGLLPSACNLAAALILTYHLQSVPGICPQNWVRLVICEPVCHEWDVSSWLCFFWSNITHSSSVRFDRKVDMEAVA